MKTPAVLAKNLVNYTVHVLFKMSNLLLDEIHLMEPSAHL